MDSQVIKVKRDEVVRKIRRFPSDDRRYIIGAAVQDLDRDMTRPYGPDRYAVLLGIAQDALGYTLTESRTRDNTDIRMIVAKELRSEGYGLEEIGTFMGRNHSTVSYYTRSMDEALAFPIAYGNLVDKYASFKNKLEDYDRRNV